MSEITKLYENAGIKPYIYCSKPQLDCDVRETGNCKQDCEYYSGEKLFTPFTKVKQIAILQFCLKWGQVHILKGIDNEYRIENSCYRQRYQPTIADAIANYINEKWQDLTKEEKQQVKGILE